MPSRCTHLPLPAARVEAPRRGSILLAVLGFIVLMGFIVTAFVEDTVAQVRYYGQFHERDDLRASAYSGLEVTLAVLNQFAEFAEPRGLYGPEQGWGDPFSYARDYGFVPPEGIELGVTFRDESGKLPLRDANPELLQQFFYFLGFSADEATEIRDRLIDWMDEDDLQQLNGFDTEDYLDLDPPYRAADAPIRSWDELVLIEGFRERFWDESGQPTAELTAFTSSYSLFHEGKVNLNAASDTLLDFFEDEGLAPPRSEIANYRAGWDRIPGTEDDRVLGEDGDLALLDGYEGLEHRIGLLWVEVTASRGEAVFLVEALVRFGGADTGAADTQAPGDAPDQEAEAAEGNDAAAERADGGPTVTDASGREDPHQRATGGVVTRTRVEDSSFGYPFTFTRLRENRRSATGSGSTLQPLSE